MCHKRLRRQSVRMFSSSRAAQRGALGVVIIAAALPVLLLLVAAIVDLARVPVAHARLLNALQAGAFGVEQKLAVDANPQVIDDAMPVGTNFCDFIRSSTGCNSSMQSAVGRRGFFSNAVSTEITNTACTLVSKSLENGEGSIFNYKPDSSGVKPFAIQFAIVRLNVDPTNGDLLSAMVVRASGDNCAGRSFSSLMSGLDVNTVTGGLYAQYDSQPLGASAWRTEGMVTGPGAKVFLSSYWLVGVGYLQVDFIFGDFFGNKHMAREYYIRPLNAAAGFERMGL